MKNVFGLYSSMANFYKSKSNGINRFVNSIEKPKKQNLKKKKKRKIQKQSRRKNRK